ncbi:hypothetical protein O3S80_43850, partial [Streptomyces sp. Lzd4kr]|nr:hypothetical protein [Streptomyces sp. Lzd4kr]
MSPLPPSTLTGWSGLLALGALLALGSLLALGGLLARYGGAEVLHKPVFGSLADWIGARPVLLGGLLAFALA